LIVGYGGGSVFAKPALIQPANYILSQLMYNLKLKLLPYHHTDINICKETEFEHKSEKIFVIDINLIIYSFILI